jgi:putative ABC transport system substrate-binding protein
LVGVLLLFAANDPEGQVRVRAFEQELQRLGWISDRNIRVEYRFAEGNSNQMRTFVQELVRLDCDVIVTNALSPILAVWRQTRAPPIVMAMASNPVAYGVMNNLSRPDENVTGFTSFEPSIVGKWLELLRAIAPGVMRVGLVFNPDAYDQRIPPTNSALLSSWLRELQTAARELAVEPLYLPVRNVEEMQSAIAALASARGGGFVVATDPFTVSHYRQIVSLARLHRLPGCFPYGYFATEGGLISYGPNGAQVFRRAAFYVDRILRGAHATDLPIQRPTTFELVINLKTASALGLSVPPLLLARADEVIE